MWVDSRGPRTRQAHLERDGVGWESAVGKARAKGQPAGALNAIT